MLYIVAPDGVLSSVGLAIKTELFFVRDLKDNESVHLLWMARASDVV